MLIVQTFVTAKEIDSEFIAPLEELMADDIVSIQDIYAFEASLPEKSHLIYHVFFGTTHNRPVGIFPVLLLPVDAKSYVPWQERYSLKGILQGQRQGHLLYTGLMGPTRSIHHVLPAHANEAKLKQESLLNDIRKKYDILAEIHPENASLPRRTHGHRYTRSHPHYKAYCEALPHQLKRMKEWWRPIYKGQLQLLVSQSLDHALRGKENADAIRSSVSLGKASVTCISVEQNQSILGMAILSHGKCNRYFAHIHSFSDLAPSPFLVQAALMTAFDIPQFHSLFIHPHHSSDESEWGLTPIHSSMAIRMGTPLPDQIVQDALNRF